MSDRVKLAREIAARTEPRFIDTNPKPKTLEERFALAREIAAKTQPSVAAVRYSFISSHGGFPLI
jgi:hypothetical protein